VTPAAGARSTTGRERMGEPEGDAAGARRARLLLLAFAAFVVYGSFFPFSFRIDAAEVQRDLARFWATLVLFDARGRRLFSTMDLGSNLLLGVPVGYLLVRGRLVGQQLAVRVGAVLAIELAFAGTVEIGQILAPTRTASALDVIAQVAGALAGTLAAHGRSGGAARELEGRVATLGVERPALLVVAGLLIVLAADALYPYALTLDVSTAWGNLKRGQWAPLQSVGRRFWGDLIVDRLIPYAALVVAGGLAFPGRAVLVWIAATATAGVLEVGKLFIVGRAPNVDNVILAAAGALLGLGIMGALTGTAAARAKAPARLAALCGVLVVYRELRPFDWVPSWDRVAAKVARIEWIPLASYFYANPQSALFDLGTKLAVSAAFGAALWAAGSRAPGRWALALGISLEALQLLQVSHVPALTDALAIGAGAALGARAIRRFRARRAARVSIATRPPR
jgi:VanZ family protein